MLQVTPDKIFNNITGSYVDIKPHELLSDKVTQELESISSYVFTGTFVEKREINISPSKFPIFHLSLQLNKDDDYKNRYGITNMRFIGKSISNIEKILLAINDIAYDTIFPRENSKLNTFDLVDTKILPILPYNYSLDVFTESDFDGSDCKVSFDIVKITNPLKEKDCKKYTFSRNISNTHKISQLKNYRYCHVIDLTIAGVVEKMHIKSRIKIYDVELSLGGIFRYSIAKKLTDLEFKFEKPIYFSRFNFVKLQFYSDNDTVIQTFATVQNIINISNDFIGIRFIP
jgi:hypothetical protein